MNDGNTRILREHLWLWCHPAGCYNGRWGLPGHSNVTPVEAAARLGTDNAVMVIFDGEPQPPFGDYAAQFAGMDKVVWSIIGDSGSKRNDTESDLKHVLDLKPVLPRLQGAIMDDFFGHGRDNPAKVKDIASRLHAAGLELWVVLYGHQMDIPGLKEFLEVCDVINFWTWKTEELPLLNERLGKLRELVPAKKIALGCYLWDFGNSKPITIEDMEFQCNLALEKWNEGMISDIVLLGSPLIGMDLETVEWTRQWIIKNKQVKYIKRH